MRYQQWCRVPLALTTIVLLSACSDSSAPTARAFTSVPLAAYTGGPDLSDFNNFPGELWVFPDVPYPQLGFAYKWSIVDDATSLVVQNGITRGLTAGICVMLASVSTTVGGHYTATVTEDPSGPFRVTGITASYGANLPIAPPVPTVNVPARRISDKLSNDYGVQFTFYH